MKLEKIANNFHKMTAGQLSFYFSFETCIAFKDGLEYYISENIWSNSTGKHLDMIDPDKKIRMPNQTFEKALSEKIKEMNKK